MIDAACRDRNALPGRQPGLDGGTMLHRLPQSQAYTGVKLVQQNWHFPVTPGSGTSATWSKNRHGDRSPVAAATKRSISGTKYHRAALGFIDPSKVRPMRIVVDGGNGMAGPMIRADPEGSFSAWTWSSSISSRTGNSLPRTESAAEENRRLIIDTVKREGADPGIAWDGDSDRCFFIDGDGRFLRW